MAGPQVEFLSSKAFPQIVKVEMPAHHPFSIDSGGSLKAYGRSTRRQWPRLHSCASGWHARRGRSRRSVWRWRTAMRHTACAPRLICSRLARRFSCARRKNLFPTLPCAALATRDARNRWRWPRNRASTMRPGTRWQRARPRPASSRGGCSICSRTCKRGVYGRCVHSDDTGLSVHFFIAPMCLTLWAALRSGRRTGGGCTRRGRPWTSCASS